jgi:hypothetical protein
MSPSLRDLSAGAGGLLAGAGVGSSARSASQSPSTAVAPRLILIDCWARLLPFRSDLLSRSRSPSLDRTTYFSKEISFAAMIPRTGRRGK